VSTLTAAQKRAFARNGFLVLHDALDEDVVAAAREAVEDDETTSEGNQNEPEDATDTFRELNRQLFDFAADLVGGDRLKHPDDDDWGTYSGEQARVGLRYPEDLRLNDPAAQTAAGLHPHVDDLTDGDGGFYALGAATYLDHVQPRNGGFTVWPGSHWMTAEHCELDDVNEEAPRGTRERAPSVRIREDSEFDSLEALYDQFCPFEVAGDPGTVTLWHGNLIHSAGRNLSPGAVRMAAFSRFHLAPGRWAPDAVAEPFAYWAGVDADGPEP
jgi:ectoine hydroxylase-related dioxygenase (phytanoyl-CoA dioxygenase family)